jgi:hypothetical protein
MLKKVEVAPPALQRQIGFTALLFTGIIGSGWLFASLYAAQIAGPAAIVSCSSTASASFPSSATTAEG